ncbi:MAG: short-chain fatty acid transporter [Verrucomicrobia bacterium]|nr:short-chain fatty acid transporter [Verrucomicrobiota bacterium]MBV8280091.1 short-chain fatty acid transporter [Verrucomicrobiota bacterium]
MRRLTTFFVRLFERYTPDPYVLAVALSILTALLAALLAPKASVTTIFTGWYNGLFSILAFAFQVLLILVTGYALSTSAPVRAVLRRLATLASTPKKAIVLTIVTVYIASFLNWGFGLVVAGLIAREIAQRIGIDFGWLVAGAYSGWMIFSSGFSSSIALSLATPGSNLNIVQKVTGQVLPLSSTLFTPLNLVPAVLLLIALPILFCAIEPSQTDAQVANLSATEEPEKAEPPRGPATLARRLEESCVLNLVIVVAGIIALSCIWGQSGFSLDLNSVIFLFLIAGLLLHWRPIAYIQAVNRAARVTGPLILQYPLYGGIMGILISTGLADVVAKAFTQFANAHTLPFWNYLASLLISLFVPSAGGHWAVQGPFAVPAAVGLHASQAATAMGVAYGEQVADMIQPFWALPVVAVAGISIRRVMGFTVMSFLLGTVLFGAALLIFV